MTARLATPLSVTALSLFSAMVLMTTCPTAEAQAQAKPAAKPAAAAPAAPAAAPQLVLGQSDLAFTFKQMGVPVEGKFKRFDAQLAFDPKKPETGKVAFGIELGSATLGDAATDAELVKPAWFDAVKVPRASFQSSAIKALGGGKFEVTGKLTIKGQSRDLAVPVALTQAGAHTTVTGALAIKRLDFKIGEGEWSDTSIVANDVQVKFKLVFTGVAPL